MALGICKFTRTTYIFTKKRFLRPPPPLLFLNKGGEVPLSFKVDKIEVGFPNTRNNLWVSGGGGGGS
jgi:hypothetical protein